MQSDRFLTHEQRQVLTELARDGMLEHRLARRANALILLDQGMTNAQVAAVLLLDPETIRSWLLLFERDGVDGLAGFRYGGRQAFLTPDQEADLVAWVTETLPGSTVQVGAWISARFGVTYESRSGLIALLHRLGFEHRRPKPIARRMNPEKQRAFIALYEALLNHLSPDEMVMFGDAVHPTYGAQPVGCWAPRGVDLAVAQTTGREHVNIQGAIDLETGTTCMLDVDAVNAQSTIALLIAISARFPKKRLIHLFLDNARCHHARIVRDWLALPDCRIRLHFIPAYSPHLNPIERLWGAMHKALMHNRCYASLAQFRVTILKYLRYAVPATWDRLRDQVSDNFRVIDPTSHRFLM